MTRAYSLVEIILALGILTLLIIGLGTSHLTSLDAVGLNSRRHQARHLAEEGQEAVRNIKDSSFTNLVDGTYGLAISGDHWVLNGGPDVSGEFSRQIVISSVDSQTKQISVTVSWPQSPQRSGSVNLVSRLSNWRRGIAVAATVTIAPTAVATIDFHPVP